MSTATAGEEIIVVLVETDTTKMKRLHLHRHKHRVHILHPRRQDKEHRHHLEVLGQIHLSILTFQLTVL